MATNIFYRIPSHKGTRIATISGGSECTLDQFCDYIINSEGLNLKDFIIAHGTKVFRSHSRKLPNISLRNNSQVDILIPLLGGKGGFGSLLRAIGAQIEKTTNRDACRDLSGRRLRDIKREDELKKLIALQEKLQEERKRRKKERLERLKKKTEEESKASKSIQELVSMFDDHDYNKRRHELSDILDAAVSKGIINLKKRKQDESTTSHSEELPQKCLRLDTDDDEECKSEPQMAEFCDSKISSLENPTTDKPMTSEIRPTNHKPKKSDLWLGLDE